VDLAVGKRLGPYEILADLGQGGMGEVYRARDSRLGRDVAIKVVSTEAATNPENLRRFEREARALASVSHPHIVAVFDVGEEGGVRYIVTELVEGRTLREVLSAGPLAQNQAARLGAEIAAALAAAHERGVLHRDIKPENIIVDERGAARVLDFGLAGRRDNPFGAAAEAEATASFASELGVVAGTVAYMSPEQARGEKLDPRSDIFSLGVVLYEALTGERPFRGGSAIETLSGILKEDPDFAPRGKPLPEPLERILRRCLEKRTEDRYHSAADLAHDLRASAFSREPGKTVKSLRPPVTSGKRLAVLLLVAAAAGLAIVLLPRLRQAGASDRTLAVLPFRVIGVESTPHLGLGLADSVIGRLASLRRLTVRPTSAISRYESAPADAIAAGKQLGVEVVLEGTLQKLEGATQASLQLTDVSKGAILWSDRIDLPEGRLFEIQDAIARGVVERLRLQLDPNERQRMGQAQAVPDDVLESYFAVRARLSESLRMSVADRKETIERLDRILDRVPDFARALGARAYARASFNFQAPTPGGPEAVLSDARRALELDPELAEPRLARALLSWSAQGGWKVVDAIQDLRAVNERSPGLELGYLDLSRILHHYGWLAEARQTVEAARRLNPTSAEGQRLTGTILWYAGDYRDALAEFRRIPPEMLRRSSVGGRYQIFQIRSQLGEDPRALMAEAEAWIAEGPTDSPLPYALLALERARSGRLDISDLERRIASADPQIGHFHHVDHILAEAYAQMGNAERSVSHLRQAATSGLASVALFDSDPLLAPIRGSAQYIVLRRDVSRRVEAYRLQVQGLLAKPGASAPEPAA
jgi:TolB-like protein